MRSWMKKLSSAALVLGLSAWLNGAVWAQDSLPTYTWTGQGENDLFVNAENWPSNMPTQFHQNGFQLLTTQTKGRYVVPAGYSATVWGFDISNIELEFGGDITSIQNKLYNGFWQRGNTSVIFGPESSLEAYENGNPDMLQITMGNVNNYFENRSSCTMNFGNVFISAYDFNNNNSSNHISQYAGTMNAQALWIGTQSVDAKENSLNVYGGAFNVSNITYIGYDSSKNTQGCGVLNIYGGSFTTDKLSGQTVTVAGTECTPNISLYVGGTDGTTFGTFTQTNTTDYAGNFNVLMGTPLTVLDASILKTNIISLANLSGKEKWNIETALFTRSADGKTVSLNTSKQLAGADSVGLNETLNLSEGVSEGWFALPDSSNPFTVELFTTEFASQEAADDFAEWLGEMFFLETEAIDTSTIQTGLLSDMSGDIFMFDFTGYDTSAVKLVGFHTSEVPEPSTWAILALGTLGILSLRKRKSC